MYRIIALCGKPGAGKSYAARQISQQYKYMVFSADKIMLKLFGEIDGRKAFEDKLKLCKETIYEICDDILENTNGRIIFDFGFWTKNERKKLKERFIKYNLIFVYFETADDIRWERTKKRNGENSPNNYHFDKETFDFLSGLFEDFSKDEEYIKYESTEKLFKELNREE